MPSGAIRFLSCSGFKSGAHILQPGDRGSDLTTRR